MISPRNLSDNLMDGGGKRKMSDVWARRALNALRGGTAVYTLYPVVGAGVGASTIVATFAAANRYTDPAAPTLIVTPAPGVDYWFCSVNLGTANGTETFNVGVVESLPVAANIIWNAHIAAVTVASVALGQFGPPFPIKIQQNATLGGIAASVSGTDSISMSILIATGL
jgi:hypothetical protein